MLIISELQRLIEFSSCLFSILLIICCLQILLIGISGVKINLFLFSFHNFALLNNKKQNYEERFICITFIILGNESIRA